MKIDFLNIVGANRLQKASSLESYLHTHDVLQIPFGHWDAIKIGNEKRAGKSINQWIKLPGGPADQLASYWNGNNVANMHMQRHVSAYLVVIVGSRKVLFSHLGNNGHLEDFYLVGEKK